MKKFILEMVKWCAECRREEYQLAHLQTMRADGERHNGARVERHPARSGPAALATGFWSSR
jgi:hypothetical protein